LPEVAVAIAIFLISSPALGQMKIMNDVEGIGVAEVRSALYDRFYTPEPGTYADQFNWIGNGYDWSGVGKGRWGTLVSPSFYLSAEHTHRDNKGIDKHVGFFDADDVLVEKTIADGFDLGGDLWLGQFYSAVPERLAVYPILASDHAEDLVGREIWLFGRSKVSSSRLDQRLGRNEISTARFNSSSESFDLLFTFDVSIADFYGPEMKGDGKIDSYDLDELNSNLGGAGYLFGDILRFEDDFTDIGFPPGIWNNDEFGLITTNDSFALGFAAGVLGVETGGFGWDEASTVLGDSGAPSFVLIDGKPAIVSIHSAPNTDSFAGCDPTELANQIDLMSGGDEYPCFISYTRKYVVGGASFELPSEELQRRRSQKRLFGDVNGDFLLTVDDILVMEEEIKRHREAGENGTVWYFNSGFDLNNDDQIDGQDMKVLMEDGFRTTVADIRNDAGEFQPDGVVNVLREAFVLTANLGMENPRYQDCDLNLDGEVNVLGDGFILIGVLDQRHLLRISPDFNGDGKLDGLDIDALVAQMMAEEDDPAMYDESFDLTSGTVEADGITINFGPAGIADGVVNRADLIFYFEEVLGTVFGDVDFDGELKSGQDTAAFDPEGTTLSSGDLNLDGEVNTLDFQFLLQLIAAQGG
jgi:hypothetical protein